MGCNYRTRLKISNTSTSGSFSAFSVDIMAEVNESVAALNESAKNATEKIPATPEGMAVAYGSLLIMALLPIFFGSFRSVRYQAEQKVCKHS